MATYRGDDQQRVEAQAGQSPLTTTLNIKQTVTSLVVVYSADPGKGGDFTLQVNMPFPVSDPSLKRPIAQK
ncbi:hypothetical protein [Cupriavidus necator]|uniref:hypothetical protein n=1 Tax=Cupriavidus necator TaxID=106590 RepID=UPI000039EC9E|nr:hypothetical protein [Cupriavidus necator]